MGIIKEIHISDDNVIGFWEINENYYELVNMVELDEEDQQTLEGFNSDKRKLEWLSVRALVRHLTKKPVKIIYNQDRKPFLSDFSRNISISHSNELTSIFLGGKNRVGIDLEYMSHKIKKVAHKFMNEKEYIIDDKNMQRYHLYIHWCIKEAIYKICDKQDINFKNNIFVEPFEPKSEGKVNALLNNKFGEENFEMNYTSFKNYIIAWCIKYIYE